MILIISSLLVTLPGILLNTGLIVTSESDNYSLKKIAASSTIHELKLLTEKAYAKLTRNEKNMIIKWTKNKPTNIVGAKKLQ